jgi:methyl-accepting chemotaxis protein
MQRALPISYLKNIVRTSTLLLAGGAILIAVGFYLAFQEQGRTTYAGNYRLLAELDQVLVTRALIVFSFTLLVSSVGAVIIAVAYSHRVAGPVYKLGMITQKIASGDLAGSVRLRTDDVLHELAAEFNVLSGHYREVLVQLNSKSRELSVLMDDLEKHPLVNDDKETAGKVSERVEELRGLLNQIKL